MIWNPWIQVSTNMSNVVKPNVTVFLQPYNNPQTNKQQPVYCISSHEFERFFSSYLENLILSSNEEWNINNTKQYWIP